VILINLPLVFGAQFHKISSHGSFAIQQDDFPMLILDFDKLKYQQRKNQTYLKEFCEIMLSNNTSVGKSVFEAARAIFFVHAPNQILNADWSKPTHEQ
jgi:hypothetical protein